jgi:outer membrane receptor protein involved in Fe transport
LFRSIRGHFHMARCNHRRGRTGAAHDLIRQFFLPALLGVGALCAIDDASAQTVNPTPAAAGRVEGQVKDALDRPLIGVRLRLETPDGKIAGQATSDTNGRYVFTGIAPGIYSLVGERPEFQTGTALVTVEAAQGARADLVLASRNALELAVQAKRLNEARDNIAPSLGATVYTMDRNAIESQAQGDNAPFNQTLLRAPGVAQDSFGQLHVRGDHANLQYRINGVLIPEGISGFGQVYDTRSAERISLITGALPAQYGYRTAGIIDIQTKSGESGNGGELGMYGGSYGTLNPSAEAYGAVGPFSYYMTGNYLQNKLGIESPDGSRNPIHDDSTQGKGFGYLSWLVNPDTRLSLLFGSAYGFFHIPNRAGQMTNFQAFGQTAFDSTQLNEKQREINDFTALSLQQSLGDFDYQVTAFGRYSSVFFKPDVFGDLLFNGSASRIYRNIATFGVQDDNAYRLNDTHTLRQGVYLSSERAIAKNDTFALPVDNTGAQLTDANGNPIDTPTRILDGSSKWGYLYGIYLQDEWKATDRLTINYGARFDYYTAFVTDYDVSPRINAVYKLTDRTTLHAGYAREFTPPPFELVAPTSVQKFVGTPLVGAVTTDSNVKVQKDHYIDAGVTHQLTPDLQVGIDGYYKDVQDLIDEGQFGTALIFTPFNYKTGTIYGVELTSSYKHENFSAYANFAYSVAQGRNIESAEFNFDPARLAFIAANDVHLDHDQTYTASLGAAYKWEAGTQVYADTIVGSGLRNGFANTTHLPAYFQINTGVSQQFSLQWFGNMTARLDILNITDEKNQLRDGTGIGVGAPQFAIRRAYFAGLSKKF